MLANGPAWMKAGVFSIVCIRLGLSVSRISTVAAPAACMSSAVIGAPCRSKATTMLADPRAQVLERLDVIVPVTSARIAISSLATMMSKPVWRGKPFASPPWPIVMSRRKRSLTSITRRIWMRAGSISSGLP